MGFLSRCFWVNIYRGVEGASSWCSGFPWDLEFWAMGLCWSWEVGLGLLVLGVGVSHRGTSFGFGFLVGVDSHMTRE